MKTISVRIPEDVANRLQAASRNTGVSKSEVIREALEAYLANGRDGDDRPTLADRCRDLIGSVDGPSDLSTNPKYMEGFGL